MNNPNMAGQPPRPVDGSGLIKPDQVLKVPVEWDNATRQKYFTGVTTLWQSLTTKPQRSPQYQEALGKLQQVTNQIKSLMTRVNQQQNPAQQNGMRPPNPAQQGHPAPSGAQAQLIQQNHQAQQVHATQQQPPQAQPAQSGVQNNADRPQSQFSQKVLDKVRTFQFAAPMNVQAKGPQVVAKFMGDARMKYASTLQQYDNAVEGLEKLEKMLFQKKKQNPQLSSSEEQQYHERKKNLESSREDARRFIQKFVEVQSSFKRDNGTGSQLHQGGDQMRRDQSQGGGVQTTAQQTPSGQAHTVSSALDAARSHSDASETARGSASSAQNATAPVNQSSNSQQPSQGQSAQTQPPQGVKPDNRPQQAQHTNTSQPPAPSQNQTSAQPFPLTHGEAIRHAARSNSNASANTPAPPGATQYTPHGHPTQHRMSGSGDQQQGGSHQKMAIPRELNLPPPQPVQMGQARPTLTNGPLAPGPIGAPAIQRHPGYVLEGEGERVLSKKKLDELVRQVTGSTGGEGDDCETMTTEVEETLLQVADEFVDQVIVSACRLAKLRGSSTLDLRDIQLILERNYNIRVPGYASDEIRAVRKVVPTPGWTQKLSAVQAAKVTAGRRE